MVVRCNGADGFESFRTSCQLGFSEEAHFGGMGAASRKIQPSKNNICYLPAVRWLENKKKCNKLSVSRFQLSFNIFASHSLWLRQELKILQQRYYSQNFVQQSSTLIISQFSRGFFLKNEFKKVWSIPIQPFGEYHLLQVTDSCSREYKLRYSRPPRQLVLLKTLFSIYKGADLNQLVQRGQL